MELRCVKWSFEPLTPSHLILGRRLLTLPDHLCQADSDIDYGTTSRVVLNRRMRYLQTVLEQFWQRWKQEYLLELIENHRYRKGEGTNRIAVGDVVIVHEDTQRGMWRLGIVEETLTGKDGETRGAVVRVKAGRGASSFLRRPIQRLYPLEVRHEEEITECNSTTESNPATVIEQDSNNINKDDDPVDEELLVPTIDSVSPQNTTSSKSQEPLNPPTSRPRRRAATEARDLIVARLLDN